MTTSMHSVSSLPTASRRRGLARASPRQRKIQLQTVLKLASYWGVQLASKSVCAGHDAPAEFLREQVFDRPPITLWHGARGAGKSLISGLGAWIDSLAHDYHGTRVLGGSLAQSTQIYEALRSFDRHRPVQSPVVLTKTHATFTTGSEVTILACSPTAVRGPHVARLRLDEVDEIDDDLRQDAMGMCMALRGVPASVVMTSTWHRVGGPMTDLLERGKEGAFPTHEFCVFEVLEHCPTERSGKHLENCPACPLQPHCHSDLGSHPSGLPKAKRSNGHYAIDALIQKLHTVSGRVFASDYLCQGPQAAGAWFTTWSDANVSANAEYNPLLTAHCAIDSGVVTAAVLFQILRPSGRQESAIVTVFAEYLAEDKPAELAGFEIKALIDATAGHGRRKVSTDSAGGARNPIGPTVIAEYRRAGLGGDGGLLEWPRYPGCVQAGLATIEALVRSADGNVYLKVHPRCVRLIDAMKSYARAKRLGAWQDYPEDPQHPHEDLVDALRGGLAIELPEGRVPEPKLSRVKAGRVF